MASHPPSIEIFEGVSEDLSDVRFRRNRSTGANTVLMVFKKLRSIERLQSFTKQSANLVRLRDEEGEIAVTPNATRLMYGGPEGDEIKQLEIEFEIDQDEHRERFQRFMERYAAANGMAYGEPDPSQGS
ncbi:MAG: photosystem II reaction center protein Psb28 [Thermosynechococcaceae cyanobacterium]